jgi:DNA-3-methyladenine glycosylase I
MAKKGLSTGEDGVTRCRWAGEDGLYRSYHDDEWGRPMAGEEALFELLMLEAFQSGLSWLTILRKREGFRDAFDGFAIAKVARYGDAEVARLLADAGIVRNRAKVQATINNARRYEDLVDDVGSLGAYVWGFEPDPEARPKKLDWDTLMTMSKTPESIAMSKDMKKRGWSFVGPITVYSFMQSAGIVNDHIDGCDHRRPCERERQAFTRPT